jgi:MFS transporter, DHA3 family, macrolide efflux protein
MVDSAADGQRADSMQPFLVIWIGHAFSLLGSQLVQFALVWWLTKTTGSATVLALASLAALLPQLLIGPLAGALVDRWRRRTVLLAADAGIALATLLLALLYWLDLAAVWAIYALLLLPATGAAFHWPAMQALAIEVLPMQGVLAIDVVTALPAIVSLLFIDIPQPVGADPLEAAGDQSSVWAEMQAGLRFVSGWKALLALSAIGIGVNMLGRAAGALSPLFVVQHFQGGVVELGWWQSAAGLGMVLGGVVLGVWGGFRRRVVTQMLALGLDGLAILVVALSPPQAFIFAVGIIFCTGFLEAIALGLSGAIAQALIPPAMQGRVFALLLSVSHGMAPLGLLLAGPIADAFGVRFWWVLTGIMITAMGGGALLVPAIVHIEDTRASRVEPAT